jgi:signal transduction histidine kinase
MNKENREIIYSIAILVLIPLLFVANTIFLTNNVRSDFNRELSRKADLVNDVLAQSIEAQLDSPESIEPLLNAVTDDHPEIKQIIVYLPSENGYVVAASTNENEPNPDSNENLQLDIVKSRKRSVSILTESTTNSGKDTRAWEVATPVINDNDEVVAVVSSSVLTTDADELIDSTFQKEYFVLIASIIVVIALLFRHFRLVGYADLLKKQREVNQTMTDFLSVATHELKAPMTVIKGYVANVIEGDYGNVTDKIKEPLQMVMDQTERLNSMVLDLLNVSRIEQGRISFDMKQVDVSKIINMLVEQYKKPAAEKGLELLYEQQEKPILLYADEGRVQEVMTNLLDNAVKYSLNGTVTIHHDIKGNKVATKIRDTGIGMTSEERSRLFQRFYRAKNDKTKTISGTGLGLWIIKQYIEKMGGSIEVDSLPDVGTEFTVWLRKG